MKEIKSRAVLISDVLGSEVRKVVFSVEARGHDIKCVFTFRVDEDGGLRHRDEPELSLSTQDEAIFCGMISQWEKTVKDETNVWDAFYSHIYRKPIEGDAFYALGRSWSLEDFERYLDECREAGRVKIDRMGVDNTSLYCEVGIGDIRLSLLLKEITKRGYGRMVFFTKSDNCYVSVEGRATPKPASIFGMLEDKLELTYVLKQK